MGQVYQLHARKVAEKSNPDHTTAHGGGNGGGGDCMQERIKSLEEKAATLTTDLAIIKTTHATKEDLHREINTQTRWISGTIIGVAGLTLAIAKYLFG